MVQTPDTNPQPEELDIQQPDFGLLDLLSLTDSSGNPFYRRYKGKSGEWDILTLTHNFEDGNNK